MTRKLAICKCQFGSPACKGKDLCPSGVMKSVRADFFKKGEKPDKCASKEPLFAKNK